MSAYARTGLASLGELPWGSHICQFFSDGRDLRDILVPWFKAGLENNERCLMVATDPFTPDDARSALRAAVGDFDHREKRGQIEIHDARAWYNNGSAINGEDIVDGLVADEQRALNDGYVGLRTHGNIGWVGRRQWRDFQDYEAGVTRALKGRRMLSMCGYCLDHCTSRDVLDVVNRHGLTLSRNSDHWACVAVAAHDAEQAPVKHDEAAETEQQLRIMLHRQSVLLGELDHRIRNNLATVQAIAGSTIRSAQSMSEFQRAFTGRIAALSKTHALLTENDQEHVPLRRLLDNELAHYDDGSDRVVLSGPPVMLPANIAVSYGMTIHELTTNALKYGAFSVPGGRLEVTWTLKGASLALRWKESNVSIPTQPTRVGFGTQLLRRLLPHQLGAAVEMTFEPDGLMALISIELA